MAVCSSWDAVAIGRFWGGVASYSADRELTVTVTVTVSYHSSQHCRPGRVGALAQLLHHSITVPIIENEVLVCDFCIRRLAAIHVTLASRYISGTVRYRANEIEVSVSPAFNFIFTYANQV